MIKGNDLDITIYQGPDDASTLKKAIAYCAAKAVFAILESLTQTDFPDPKTVDIDPMAYPKGRVFCDEFELRWEKMEGTERFRTALATQNKITNDDKSLSSYFVENEASKRVRAEFQNGSGGTIEDYTIYLRPEKDTSLGRPLQYNCIKNRPNKRDPNAVLTIKRYRDARGRLIFWRYCKMEWE